MGDEDFGDFSEGELLDEGSYPVDRNALHAAPRVQYYRPLPSVPIKQTRKRKPVDKSQSSRKILAWNEWAKPRRVQMKQDYPDMTPGEIQTHLSKVWKDVKAAQSSESKKCKTWNDISVLMGGIKQDIKIIDNKIEELKSAKVSLSPSPAPSSVVPSLQADTAEPADVPSTAVTSADDAPLESPKEGPTKPVKRVKA